MNDAFSAYFLRINEGAGYELLQTVGDLPDPHDEQFVNERMTFILTLYRFNELREASEVSKHLTMIRHDDQGAPDGTVIRLDLRPEFAALSTCLARVQKRLSM